MDKLSPLKVVHRQKPDSELEQEAKELWENVLKPKWEKRDKERAIKQFAKYGMNVRNEMLK